MSVRCDDCDHNTLNTDTDPSSPSIPKIWFTGLPGSGKTSAINKLIPDKGIKCNSNNTETSTNVSQELFELNQRKYILWRSENVTYLKSEEENDHNPFQGLFQDTKLIVFSIDSNDLQQIFDSRKELQNISTIPWLRKIPIIIFCNKQDLRVVYDVPTIAKIIGLKQVVGSNVQMETTEIEEIKEIDEMEEIEENKYDDPRVSDPTEYVLNDHPVQIIGGSVHSGDGMTKLLGQIEFLCTDSIHAKSDVDPDDDQQRDDSVGSWMERKDELDHDAFIENVLDRNESNSDPLDHYQLIRLLWIYHNKHSINALGRSTATQEIVDLLQSRWPKARNTGITAIYFWSQMTLFAMESVLEPQLRDRIRHEFPVFIACHPELCQSTSLIRKYYTQSVWTKAQQCPTEFFMPDIQPLPSLITKVEDMKATGVKPRIPESPKIFRIENVVEYNLNSLVDGLHSLQTEDPEVDDDHIDSNEDIPKTEKLNDMKVINDFLFVERFENGLVDGVADDHALFIRVIWSYLSRHPHTYAVEIISDQLKLIQGPSYHETLTQFWISMVLYYKTLCLKLKCKSYAKCWPILKEKEWSIAGSMKLNMDDPDLWKRFYSEKTMHQCGFEGIDAAKQLVIADLRQLPSAVCYFRKSRDLSASTLLL